MAKELTIYLQNNKILREEKITVVKYDPKTDTEAHSILQTVVKEKVMVITFNNGNKIEKITISNLGEKRDGRTKEQLLNQRIIEGNGHIMIADGIKNRILRISNIISVEIEWQTL